MQNDIRTSSVPLPDTPHLNGHAPLISTQELPRATSAPSGEPPRDLQRRLEAQPHAQSLPEATEARERDAIPRRRDDEGRPIPNTVVFHWPALFSGRTLRETALARAFDALGEKLPVRTALLEAQWDDALLPVRERHIRANDEAWERLRLENEETQRRNLALEARREELERERDAATRANREALDALAAPLEAANHAASDALARAGHPFDPSAPSTETLLAHEPLSLRTLAGALSLPFDENDRDWGEHLVRWSSLASGAVLGTSVVLLTGLLQTSQLTSSGNWLAKALWLFFVAVGYGVAHEILEALTSGARDVWSRFWMRRAASEWRPLAYALGGQTLVIAFVWSLVDGFGLAKLGALKGLTGGTAHSIPIVAIAATGLVVSLPFLFFALARGAVQGRFHGLLNVLLHEQEAEFCARDAEIRSRPEVQAALARVADVLDLHREAGLLRERIETTAALFETERAVLEAQKCAMRRALSEEERQLIQDSHNDWVGACGAWRGEFEQLLAAIEPLPAPGQWNVGDRTDTERTPSRSGQATRRGWLARLGERVRGWFHR